MIMVRSATVYDGDGDGAVEFVVIRQAKAMKANSLLKQGRDSQRPGN
jgi:hypothetical protein